jgi:glycerol kinase
MAADGARYPETLRVDGGMAANDWLCQFLADLLDATVERPAQLETTALGAAFHAGLAVGVWPGLDALAQTWTSGRSFTPRMGVAERAPLVAGWRDAVSRTLSRPLP